MTLTCEWMNEIDMLCFYVETEETGTCTRPYWRSVISSTRERNSSSFHSFRYAPLVKRRNFSHSWKKSQIFNRDSCKNILVYYIHAGENNRFFASTQKKSYIPAISQSSQWPSSSSSSHSLWGEFCDLCFFRSSMVSWQRFNWDNSTLSCARRPTYKHKQLKSVYMKNTRHIKEWMEFTISVCKGTTTYFTFVC